MQGKVAPVEEAAGPVANISQERMASVGKLAANLVWPACEHANFYKAESCPGSPRLPVQQRVLGSRIGRIHDPHMPTFLDQEIFPVTLARQNADYECQVPFLHVAIPKGGAQAAGGLRRAGKNHCAGCGPIQTMNRSQEYVTRFAVDIPYIDLTEGHCGRIARSVPLRKESSRLVNAQHMVVYIKDGEIHGRAFALQTIAGTIFSICSTPQPLA